MLPGKFFIANQADYGAGMLSVRNIATISNNMFKDNIALQAGGGLSLGSTNPIFNTNLADISVVVQNNSFINNSAGYGAAIASEQEVSVSILNNIFNQNAATVGGSIHDVSSTSYLIQSNTFAHNSATSSADEIWLDGLEGSVNGVTNIANVISQLTKDSVSLFADEIAIQ